jgi:hypothetical protein
MAATASRMRGLLPVITVLLGGCSVVVAPATLPAETAIPYAPAGPHDVIVSDVPVLRCNVFRLLTGRSYCRPVELPPVPPAYCTRGLAGVDCWAIPNPYGYYQREVADGPMRLTPEQEWNRTGRWPGALQMD